jgi:hypothetical protein
MVFTLEAELLDIVVVEMVVASIVAIMLQECGMAMTISSIIVYGE